MALRQKIIYITIKTPKNLNKIKVNSSKRKKKSKKNCTRWSLIDKIKMVKILGILLKN